jgi:hypothetical protein
MAAVRTFLKKLYRFFLFRLTPESRAGDHFVSLVIFLRAHRRLPTNKQLFNDVLYRIKISDEITDPLRVFVSDKEFVKLYVKALAGDQFNVPTITVLRSIEEATAYPFPPDCCIKPTHLSGKVILRRQGSQVDLGEIGKWFKTSFYHENREANYKTLQPKVIVEPLIFDSDNLSDYKIFCYRGKPKLIQVDVDRHIRHTRKLYDLGWNELPCSIGYPRSDKQLEKPANLDKMLEVASLLSSRFGFVRVDLYSNGKECLVGEITNCHGNAEESFMPESGEPLVSRMIFG